MGGRVMNLRRFSTLPVVGGLALTYFVVAKLSFGLAFVHASASSVWPATGLALAALLLFGYRVWPGIFLEAFLVNAVTAGNLASSFGVATGNTLEALCGAWLVHRLASGTRAFDRAQDVFKFALSVLLSTLISPSIGLTSLALAEFASWENYGSVWATWWMADAIGALVVTPLLLLWCEGPRWSFHWKRDCEQALLLIALIAVGEIVFGGWFPISPGNYPISFLCGPVVVWAAFRLSQRETAAGLLILSGIAV